ncbi:hypothetical protein Drorol1_Dr00015432, partial [Drosera rotundifolia]
MATTLPLQSSNISNTNAAVALLLLSSSTTRLETHEAGKQGSSITSFQDSSGLTVRVSAEGPLSFQYSNFDGRMPSFLQNNNSWTKVANIIFFDAPVGTGFSYGTTT